MRIFPKKKKRYLLFNYSLRLPDLTFNKFFILKLQWKKVATITFQPIEQSRVCDKGILKVISKLNINKSIFTY